MGRIFYSFIPNVESRWV